MKWYNNMKVTRQLIAIVVALILGFGAIGFSYYRVVTIEGDATANMAELIGFQALVEGTRSDLLIAQRYAREFQVSNQLESLEGFDTTMNRALESANRIAGRTPTPDSEAVIANLEAGIVAFQASVYAASEPQLSIGLDANSGFIGDLQDISNAVSKTLSKTPNATVEASFLRIRNHEKDHISLGDPDSATAANAEYENLVRMVRRSSLATAAKNTLLAQFGNYKATLDELVANIDLQAASRSEAQSIANDLDPLLNSLITIASDSVTATRENADKQSKQITFTFVATLAAIFLTMSVLLLLLSRKLSGSLRLLQRTVTDIGSGNFDSRTGLLSGDELGILGQAFDDMLDERLTQLSAAASENDQLNNSVVNLMEAVSRLSERDLTVKVPVSEDVTGPVADAINLMAEETAKVLLDISESARNVGKAAAAVKGQGDNVTEEAMKEREVVKQTVATLTRSAEAMKEVAGLAQGCFDLARDATAATTAAVGAVERTSDGMNDIRETISETEKRIKRLGERSQEINAVVDIINGIAERTHVLALNASMQAAAAGEAGRGFAVVADEVQRLAESSRESTSQIGALVNNIQVETAETMATMNKTIDQVVEGTEVAKLAGEKMKETNTKSAALSNSVRRIADSSNEQAESAKSLVSSASEIEASTERTRGALEEQAVFTDKLVEFSKQMLNSVRVFTLPGVSGTSDAVPVLSESDESTSAQGNGAAAAS